MWEICALCARAFTSRAWARECYRLTVGATIGRPLTNALRSDYPRRFCVEGTPASRRLAGETQGEEGISSCCRELLPPLVPLHLLGYAIDRRPSYRVLIPQSVYLAALIFSLRFMKMSAYRPRRTAKVRLWRRAERFRAPEALRDTQLRAERSKAPEASSNFGAQRSECASPTTPDVISPSHGTAKWSLGCRHGCRRGPQLVVARCTMPRTQMCSYIGSAKLRFYIRKQKFSECVV